MEASEYLTMRALEERYWWYAGLHDLVIRWARREAAGAGKPLQILDCGCGTGQLCTLLQPFGPVTGCDIHPLALEATAQRGITNVHRWDVMSDHWGVEQYDLITCMDVLSHRAVTDDRAALGNLYRALRKGGLLLIQVPAFRLLRGDHDLAVHNQHRYRRGELVCRLGEAGFQVEVATYRLFPLFLPAMLWRGLNRLSVSYEKTGLPPSDLVRSVPAWLNHLLTVCVLAENRFLIAGVTLFLGTSVFAAARKPFNSSRPSGAGGNTPGCA